MESMKAQGIGNEPALKMTGQWQAAQTSRHTAGVSKMFSEKKRKWKGPTSAEPYLVQKNHSKSMSCMFWSHAYFNLFQHNHVKKTSSNAVFSMWPFKNSCPLGHHKLSDDIVYLHCPCWFSHMQWQNTCKKQLKGEGSIPTTAWSTAYRGGKGIADAIVNGNSQLWQRN